MATTANKSSKQFIAVVYEKITARRGTEPGVGKVKLKTALYNEDDEVNEIVGTNALELEVYNRSTLEYKKNEEVEVWQDGYGVFWVNAVPDNREYFVINLGKKKGDTPINNVALYTKGSLHYVVPYGDVWVPANGNETTGTPTKYNRARPANSKLVICQEDAPKSEVEYHMPYYTPEANMGVLPTVNSVVSLNEDRFGCFLGDHVFTDKCFDYKKCGNTFVYEPSFLALVQAIGQTGGQQDLYVAVGNEDFDCNYPRSSPISSYLLSGASFPDIWEYDYIIVLFDCNSYTAEVIDYPKDYPDGTVMPVYRNWLTGTYNFPGRGWQVYDPYGSTTVDIFAEFVNSNSPAYTPGGGASGIWVDTNGDGAYADGKKAIVRKGSLAWAVKVKTKAIT